MFEILKNTLHSSVKASLCYVTEYVNTGPLMDHGRGSCIEDQLTTIPNRKLLIRKHTPHYRAH